VAVIQPIAGRELTAARPSGSLIEPSLMPSQKGPSARPVSRLSMLSADEMT
jgi:hypothetical protein